MTTMHTRHEITHEHDRQIVTPAELRRVLRAQGETCFCAPDSTVEWDAGRCPQHKCETRQSSGRDEEMTS